MAATATRTSANPLRMEGTRQSADGRSASEQRHRLGSSATNGPRRKPSMAERLFKKHTIEDQGFVSESRGAADTPAPLLCKRAFKELRGGRPSPLPAKAHHPACVGQARMWRKCE